MTGNGIATGDELAPLQHWSKSETLWQKLRLDPLAQFVFLSLLLLGSDRIAISVAGLTLRIVFPIIMTAVFFLYMNLGKSIAFEKGLTFLFLALATAGALSALNSASPLKSVGYTIWVLFDFFVVISLCYNFAKLYRADLVLSFWFLVFRIHAFLIFLEFGRNLAVHATERPQLWFYEPSYLAVFMTAYFGSSLFMLLHRGRKYLPDFSLATVSMLTLTSATAVFGILFAIILNFLIARQRLKILIWSAAVGGSFLGVLYAFFHDTRYFENLVGFFFQQDILRLILERGGDRWIRVVIGWDAFLHHPWLGVGIGGDSAYMHIAAYPEYAVQLIRPWTDVRGGEPFCNIFVEILGTTGILGFIPFFAILAYAAWSMIGLGRKDRPPVEAVVLFVGFFSTLLAMQLDGTVLRYYAWSSLGLAFGILARSREILQTPKTEFLVQQ